jgi:RHS repeat-associated protein
MVATVTSYNNATPGSGTVLNQVQLTYNTFSQLTKEQQEHSGSVTGSSANVQYSYDSGASSSNEIRPATITYPNARVITNSYGTSGGMNDRLNRVDTIQDTTSGTTSLASYTYLGLGTVVRITYPQSSVWLDLWGGTSGTFNGLDLFNRVIDQRWQNSITGSPTDIDRYQYGYDQDSNRLYKANVVGTPIVTGGLDEFYAYDHLNRVTEMQRGTLNSTRTGITGTPVREMDWTLDPTGNWPTYLTKTSGTTDLNQTRTSNKVNEITAIGGTPTWVTTAYDAAGNMTTMPQVTTPTSSYTAVYDAWNRMVQISASGTTVAKYQYDGRNRRAVKLTYTGGTLSETRHFYFTNAWEDIEERVGTSPSMDKQYVWGTRYVDELVCRDDATPQRLYAMQDSNLNLTAITNVSGIAEERYLFDPYGSRVIMDASWGSITSSSYSWVIGHQGLFSDAETTLIYNRHRFLHVLLGRFTSRDYIEYTDGTNLYMYLKSCPLTWRDPSGLACDPPCPYDGIDNPQDICAKAAERKDNFTGDNPAPDDGGVICSKNGTRKTACSWHKPFKVPKGIGGKSEPDAATAIINDCIRKHEQTHADSKDTNCPSNGCGRLTIPPGKQKGEESNAYKAQLDCLNASINKCNGDANCLDYINREIAATKDKITS